MDDDCPVCHGPLQNPSQPVPCCRKVFCHSCLRQAIQTRPQCPYCRSPINDQTTIQCNVRLQGIDDSLQTTRTVGPNLQTVLNQLRAANVQALQTASNPNVSLPNQLATNAVVQGTGRSAFMPLRRSAPRRRRNAIIQVAPAAAPVIPAPNPFSVQANTSSQLNFQSDDLSDMSFFRTYNCPFCQEDGLDDLALRDHCNANHLNDWRQVVCPVCVSLPHGNPTYFSRNFIGHLNLRHNYYMTDITNPYQNDDVNLQDAIMRSWKEI